MFRSEIFTDRVDAKVQASTTSHATHTMTNLRAVDSIKIRKTRFDDTKFTMDDERTHNFKGNIGFLDMYLSDSPDRRKKPKNYEYFCDWFPDLFGIDEDRMPSSDEECMFEDAEEIRELEERANSFTTSQLDELRMGARESFTDEELRKAWVDDNKLIYGRRRPRVKPILQRPNQTPFECICDIDRRFSRHHISHFGGGELESGQEYRIPHFVAFWENYRDKENTKEMDDLSKIFESSEPEEEKEDLKAQYFRPISKLPGPKKNDIKKFRQQILSNFRPLDCREIRRYRMPYAEALYLELQEDRFFEAAFFFKYLLVKDFYVHQSPQVKGRALRQNKPKLNKVIAFLKIAERFARRKEFHKEAFVLLRSGKYFNDHDESWWWLAEELYTRAVTVSKKSVIDGGKSEALSRYILGTFLLDCVYRVHLAQEHLSKARELSLGKDWNAERILKKTQEPVATECANYLCRALIEAGKQLRKNGKPEEALPLIHQSYKLCQESRTSRRDVEMETYFELGMTYQEVELLDWAKVAFKKFIEIAKLQNYHKRICDGYLELAICYRSEGDFTRCHHNLLNYLETATESQDENLVAFGYRYLGEFHLNNGNPEQASEFFKNAFTSFHKQCKESLEVPFTSWEPEHFTLPHDMELARVFAGISEGESLTKQICHLILQAKDSRNQRDSVQLIRWKNKGEKLFQGGTTQAEDTSDFQAELDAAEFVLSMANVGNILETERREVQMESSIEILEREESDIRTVRFAVEEKKEEKGDIQPKEDPLSTS